MNSVYSIVRLINMVSKMNKVKHELEEATRISKKINKEVEEARRTMRRIISRAK
ncbi:hypothetical protein GQ473_00950 [archaeon]|nr:hypothetical protein [archaeon]